MKRFLLYFLLLMATYNSQARVVISKTWVIAPSQFSMRLGNTSIKAYLTFKGEPSCYSTNPSLVLNDTIHNLSGFLDSVTCSRETLNYRYVFENNRGGVDSIWQVDLQFKFKFKLYTNTAFFKVVEYDEQGGIKDQFLYNYINWLKERKQSEVSINQFFRSYTLYDYKARNNYSVANIWLVSIGNDDYGPTAQLRSSRSDAVSYATFFKEQYRKLRPFDTAATGFHATVLLDSQATKANIVKTLKDIGAKASFEDYFLFVFNGISTVDTNAGYAETFFLPYDVTIDHKGTLSRKHKDQLATPAEKLSLKELQEYLQQIPAENQLFITEAGQTANFRSEFARTLMQNSPDVASVLNKNRVLIVPNGYGMEGRPCNTTVVKGYLNYLITSLDSSQQFFDLFTAKKAGKVAAALKQKGYECKMTGIEGDYFDIFFERPFLRQYQEIFSSTTNQKRGSERLGAAAQQINAFSGKRYALVVGANTYASKSWATLKNPINDASEVADVLAYSYGFDVTLLKDPAMDSVYGAIRTLYKTLQPNDQLIVYFAGHGDFDDGLLDDGFIVCSDSKPYEQDPVRNTYIQHSKLKKMINKIPAQQILVILDICHGGFFDENVLGGKRRDNTTENTLNRNTLQYLKDKSVYKSRWMLSSVGKESAFDGNGKHSPFANLLLQILKAQAKNETGIVTLSGIFTVLQQSSLNENETLKISPHKAGFGDNEALSEFILLPRGN